MKEKRISFGQGHGSLTHNNREFTAANVDPLRTPDNITFVCQPIGEAYDQLFNASTERYNAKQKRNDRKVHGSYYEHLFGVPPCNTVRTAADKRKSFYEDVVQIGRKEDSGVGTEDFQLVADCLKEYMEGFQARNPNFYVFNSVLHMDEATPHLHIDYIPVGHYKRGQDTQNGIAQALKEMGYGEGKQAIARWRAAEIEVLNAICREHGIEPLPPEKSRGTLEVEEYKEQRRQADDLAEQNAQTEAELSEKLETLRSAKEKSAKLVEIDSIEVKKSMFGKKVTLSEEDYTNLVALAQKEVVSVRDTRKLKAERKDLLKKVADLENALQSANTELAAYRKKEEDARYFSRTKLNAESKRISREEQLKTSLQKALAVIDRYGLRDEYNHIKLSTAQKKNVLE